MGVITVIQRFRIAEIIPFQYPRWPPRGLLEILQRTSPPKHKSDWAKTWWEASEWHRGSELLKLFCSVPISKMVAMVAILKFFKRHLLPNRKFDWAKTWLEASVTQRFRIAKIVPFQCPKFFKQHFLPNHTSDWAETWWEALEHSRDSELLKSFPSDIQDGCHGGSL